MLWMLCFFCNHGFYSYTVKTTIVSHNKSCETKVDNMALDCLRQAVLSYGF